MQRVANAVRGWVEVRVTGGEAEEFFNLCARRDLGFWAARRLDGANWSFRCSFLTWPKIRTLADGGRWQLTLLRRGGAPGLLWQLRYRWALLAGLCVCLAAVGVLSRFVFTVQVSGNVRVPTGTILSQLRARGVRPGAFGPGLDARQIGHEVLLEVPELSWMSINLHGTVCEVLVREGTPRPELVEEDVPAQIVAKYPGIITAVEATRGQALVDEGQTVAAGDTLISGWVDFEEPEGYQGDMGGMWVHAGGRVRARTWHTLRSAAPLEETVKVYTGREKRRRSVELFGRRVNFYEKGGISYDKYDKILSYHPAPFHLPVCVRTETCREYETQRRQADRQETEEALKGELQRRLEALCDPDEVRQVDYAVEERDGLLHVTLLAQCEQDIGLTVED